MKTILMLVVATVLVIGSGSCHSGPTTENTVVVRVFRDSKSPSTAELDRKLWKFNEQKHRVSSGKYILAATMTFYSSKDLGEALRKVQPQIVVLDSIADIAVIGNFSGSIGNAKNACTTKQGCYAFISDWVHGDELMGARILLDQMATD